VLGVNCAFGPQELTETVRYITSNWPRLVSALPNAGLPVMVDGKSHFPMNPADFTKGMLRFVDEFGVNIVGGCCGTMPEHLKMLCEAVGEGRRAFKPRTIVVKPQVSSLMAAVDIRQDNSYLIVAERTNTNGSRQFKRLLQATIGTAWFRWPATKCARVAPAGCLRRFRRPGWRARHARSRQAIC
jgi:5-methyltetrahydrofolate--homocysteine methyltransferase